MPFTILIVDDKLENRVLLRHMLKKSGGDFHFIEAENGRVACNLFDEHRDIDLIFMDVMMPELDGINSTRLIKQRTQHRHVPIIFVTALDDLDTLQRCLHSGGDDFIGKPVSPVVLQAKLIAHLRIVEQQRQLERDKQLLSASQQQTYLDHRIVEKMFQQAVSHNRLDLPGLQFYQSPLSMFNGDLMLVTEHPQEGMYLLVADFTGHGLAAAMGSLPVSEVFFAMTRKGLDIGTIAAEMHAKLQDLLPVSMFCCAILINLDPARQHLKAWVGGMDSFLIIGSNGKLREEIPANHLPLGVHWGSGFDRNLLHVDLCEGDRILCYTDGVTDATNWQGEMFGKERLQDLLEAVPAGAIDRVIEDIHQFCGEASQRDDITLVEVLCHTPADASLAAELAGFGQASRFPTP